MLEKFEKLVAAGIELIPAVEVTTHFIFQRDGFVALVERRGEGFGGVGSSGLLTERGGLAPLVWRGEQAVFVGREFEQDASADDVSKLRAFAADLKSAIE
jgi:hypothetical protein